MEQKTVMLGKYGPYIVNCYYCGLPVTERTHGWNADVEGVLYLVHADCMSKEEKEILSTNNWNRGEQYRHVHSLINPLSEGIFQAKCGCTVSMLKDTQNGKFHHFMTLLHLCNKHIILRVIYISHYFGCNKYIRYLDERVFSFFRKPLNSLYRALFLEAYATGIIDDPDHEKEYGVKR